jgi:uncharacterized protein (DUF1800 family)
MADDVALLLRRAGFGPTAAELAAARRAGYAATLSSLTNPVGPDVGAASAPIPVLGPDPYTRLSSLTDPARPQADRVRQRQIEQIVQWWLDRMIVANHQATEKLVFFWHGHWATSVTKVKSPQLMLAQHRTLRGARDFVDMARRMVVDPALVTWLDGQLNTKDAPNENLGRELFELFLLGIGHYTEQDVKEAGRALTGWKVNLSAEKCVSDPESHDAGGKNILGTTAKFNARSLVDLLLRHEACPRFIASRLWYRYASSTEPIPDAVRDRMVAAFPSPMAMLRVLFQEEAFQATRGSMVKQPIEWVVGAMRQLGLRAAHLDRENFIQIYDWLAGLGQRPLAPPSVGGWPAGAAWLTSAAAQLKISVAGRLASLTKPSRLTPEEVANILCIDTWSDRTYAVLREVRKPELLLALALASPEYQVT